MTRLVVTVAGRVHELEAGQAFTFGRDVECTACLDPLDRGISRVAGSIGYESGTWWIVNRSAKRTLHVVDDTGISVPIPVSAPDGQPCRRAVDRTSLTILVIGTAWTHALTLSVQDHALPQTVADPRDPNPTITHLPSLTDRTREALVALAAGYLQAFPRYDPHPRTYQEAAEFLGLEKTQVSKRIEHLRGRLAEAGVPGLEGTDDARRQLVEWALSMRLVGPEDLEWLEKRLAERRTEGPS